MQSRTWLGAVAALLVTAGAAMAATPKYPANVTGFWKIYGNGAQTTLGLAQAGGTSHCRAVTGHIYANEPIKGIYCPSTGRLVFGRNPGGTTIQVWQAQFTRTAEGQVLLTGSLMTVTDAGGAPGEYSFWGVKP